MSFTNLLRHHVRFWRPPATATYDAYGNPADALVRDSHVRRAFVQIDGKTEVGGAEGNDAVIADLAVYIDPREGEIPDERCEVEWSVHTDARRLKILSVREEQGPGTTHHVLVLCREGG